MTTCETSAQEPKQLTLFVEDSPARTCPLPDAAQDWLESDPDCGTSSTEFLSALDRTGWSSRMSPVFSAATKDGTLPPSFRGWSNSGMASVGGCWTLSISEWPSAAAVCSLSDILETDVPRKYFLSARACAGILRRAERRGKKLPPYLRAALEQSAQLPAEASPSSASQSLRQALEQGAAHLPEQA